MREAVSDMGGNGNSGGEPAMGKVWCISERPVSLADNPDGARLRTLALTTRTPSQAEVTHTSTASRGGTRSGGRGGRGGDSGSGSRSSSGSRGGAATAVAKRSSGGGGSGGGGGGGILQRAMKWHKSNLHEARPVAPSPPLVASPGGSAGFQGGLLATKVGEVVPLPELGTQLFSDRREVLCLTSAGMQTLMKLRPVDHLYDLLAHNQAERVRRGVFVVGGGGDWGLGRRGGGGGGAYSFVARLCHLT